MTTQNVNTGELYNVRFDLFKEIFKLGNWNISTKRLLIIERSSFYVNFFVRFDFIFSHYQSLF